MKKEYSPSLALAYIVAWVSLALTLAGREITNLELMAFGLLATMAMQTRKDN